MGLNVGHSVYHPCLEQHTLLSTTLRLMTELCCKVVTFLPKLILKKYVQCFKEGFKI